MGSLTTEAMWLRKIVVLLTTAAVVTGDYCFPPLVEVNGHCIYISTEALSWTEARDYCKALVVQTAPPDLVAFKSCDEFVVFAGYLGFNVLSNASLWVGSHTEFLGNSWRWVDGRPLSTGVPFWAHIEGHDKEEDCAAMEGKYAFKLADHDCQEKRQFVCASAITPEYKTNENNSKSVECPHHTVQIGENCYYFSYSHSTNKVPWRDADGSCRSVFHGRGQLFSPSSCDEFAHVAHYLEVENYRSSFWVGARDVTGAHEWFWLNGDLIPGGPPFWATDEPNHESTAAGKPQAAIMSSSYRFYLEDEMVYNYHYYICKVTPYDRK